MGRAWTPLFLLRIAAIFLFVGILYLTVFASMQKTWAQTVDQLLSQCQSVGNVENPYNVAASYKNGTSGYNGSCTQYCDLMYSSCLPRNLCNPATICNQLVQICKAACNSVPQPTTPSCTSLGGVCMHRLSCSPDYQSLSAGDNDCSRFGNYSCCVPKTPCEAAGGTCVSASSQGVAPCPAGKTYNTTISCNNNYAICCTAPGTQPPSSPPPTPTYSISGQVFNDTNRNGQKDGNEQPVSNATITINGHTPHTTNSNGNYYYSGYYAGTYTIAILAPAGYVVVPNTPKQYTVTLGPNNATGKNFAIVNIYSISGNVFNDMNKDGVKDLIDPNTNPVDEPNITTGINITTSGGTLSYPATGAYQISNLFEGQYTVSFTTTPLPTGFFMTYPLNGPPPQFKIYVGPNCGLNANLSNGATCQNGNLFDANFGMSNSYPWFQTYGLNMRIDVGFEDKIPASPDYPAYASVADDANGTSNLVTPTPSFTPTPTVTPTPVSYGNCTTGDGYAGKCYDRQKDYCVGYYDDGWYCPGGDNIQCCVKTQVSCKSGTGTCHNRYSAPSWMSPGSNNGNTYACNGSWVTNLCPGPSDVQCCAQ